MAAGAITTQTSRHQSVALPATAVQVTHVSTTNQTCACRVNAHHDACKVTAHHEHFVPVQHHAPLHTSGTAGFNPSHSMQRKDTNCWQNHEFRKSCEISCTTTAFFNATAMQLSVIHQESCYHQAASTDTSSKVM